MYCHNCGKKINRDWQKCPECNEDVANSFEYNEYCGGFYGLSQHMPTSVARDVSRYQREHQAFPANQREDNVQIIVSEVKKIMQDASGRWEKQKERMQEFICLLALVNVITLVAMVMITAVFVKKIDTAQETILKQSNVIEEKNNEIEGMTTMYEELMNKFNLMQNEANDSRDNYHNINKEYEEQ